MGALIQSHPGTQKESEPANAKVLIKKGEHSDVKGADMSTAELADAVEKTFIHDISKKTGR